MKAFTKKSFISILDNNKKDTKWNHEHHWAFHKLRFKTNGKDSTPIDEYSRGLNYTQVTIMGKIRATINADNYSGLWRKSNTNSIFGGHFPRIGFWKKVSVFTFWSKGHLKTNIPFWHRFTNLLLRLFLTITQMRLSFLFLEGRHFFGGGGEGGRVIAFRGRVFFSIQALHLLWAFRVTLAPSLSRLFSCVQRSKNFKRQ